MAPESGVMAGEAEAMARGFGVTASGGPERSGSAPEVPSTLARARQLVTPELRRAAESLAPEVRRVAAYHLGFADAGGRPVAGKGGKALRPALAILSAEAVGAPAEVAIPGAVAVELVHNFSLLHDDVLDRDLERRHRPTAWAVFGEAPAIVGGDALLALAQGVLLDPARPEAFRAALALARATSAMVAGQAEDLAFESLPSVSLADCLRMCERKTAALLSCAACIGAILAGARERGVAALATFGRHLGVAFQAVDDLLGIWGRPEVTGKPVWSDLRRRKKSLPVVFALVGMGPWREPLAAVLSAPRLDEAELELAARLVEEGGGRSRTEREAVRRLDMALSALDGLGLDSGARRQLEELAIFVTRRDF